MIRFNLRYRIDQNAKHLRSISLIGFNCHSQQITTNSFNTKVNSLSLSMLFFDLSYAPLTLVQAFSCCFFFYKMFYFALFTFVVVCYDFELHRHEWKTSSKTITLIGVAVEKSVVILLSMNDEIAPDITRSLSYKKIIINNWRCRI